jgi:hypothetical protein
MMPRFASSVITTASFAQQVFRCTEEEWRRLPPQMRGFVLHRQTQGLTPRIVLDGIDAGRFGSTYDPQGTFDAFQGLQPA